MDEKGYYERKSLEDSMRFCFYCLIGLIMLAAACGIYSLLK